MLEGIQRKACCWKEKGQREHVRTRQQVKAKTADSEDEMSTGQGVTLVAATPTKAPKRAMLQPSGSLNSMRISRSPTPGIAVHGVIEEEEDWSLPSSPDILLLGIGRGGICKEEGLDRRLFENEGRALAFDTPVKKPQRWLIGEIRGRGI